MLQLERKKEENKDILRLIGEVDASNSILLDQSMQEILDQGATVLLIDGTELEYISSAGLGVFMSYLDDFSERGIRFAIFGLNEQVNEVFKILGLDRLIAIAPDLSTASTLAHES
jgi:anti-sigma B factor antagonist